MENNNKPVDSESTESAHEQMTRENDAVQSVNDISPDLPADDEVSGGEKTRTLSVAAEIFDYFELFVISACAVLLVFSFFFRLCRVDGQSMEVTLFHNEMLVVSNLFGKPERGDVVVFHQTGEFFNEPIVKRVIATENEWVSVVPENGRLTVTVYDPDMKNPRVLDEDYARYADYLKDIINHDYPVQVPEGCYFVMGDNRNHSTDSRSAAIGFVDGRRILGVVLFRVTPLSKFGAIN